MSTSASSRIRGFQWLIVRSLPILVCISGVAALNAQSSTDSESTGKPSVSETDQAAQVRRLISELDADTVKQRDTAEAELLKLGSTVFEFVPSRDEDASPEWQMRMERVLRTIEERELAALTLPSTVTLSGEMTGREAIRAISLQTENQITLDEVQGLDATVQTDFNNTPFWEAIDEVLDQLDLTIAAGSGREIQIVPRAPTAPLRTAIASYIGVFRLEVISIDKVLSLYRPEESHSRVHLALAWEPRLQPVFVRFQLAETELTCDDGQLLIPTPNQDTDFTPSEGSQLQVALEFNLPTKEAKRILRWNGGLLVAIPGKPLTLEFKDLASAANIKQSVRDLSVVLEKARKNSDIYEALVGVSLDQEGKSNQAIRGWASTHEAFLKDPTGKRIDNMGWSTTRRSGNGIGFSYQFDLENGWEGYTFHYRAPGSIVETPVQYTIEDVPLP